ncbi:hypothetical protein [Rhabdothermincola salaria]|uniref:hypothetical protein n=1 Tax=Rhabdothermincola salaria TaxID=2903142 RepID=UPI001E60D506|nr:hypothetical protein [Rhabdothermincola salaria]MCD9624480.1 hypothetical protein [Rhabdothermincola salaria]
MNGAVCPACGAPRHPGALACDRCGLVVDEPEGRGLLWAAIAVVVIGVVIAGGIVVWAARSGGGGAGEVFVASGQASSTSTTSTTSTTTTTTEPTTTPTPAPAPPPSAPVTTAPFDWTTAVGSPYEAIADWATALGLNYVGLCDQLDSMADHGVDPWCASVFADRGAEVVFRLADFPGGDFGVWVLTAATPSGWQVVDDAEDTGGGPPF